MSDENIRAEILLIELLTRYQIKIQACAYVIVRDFQLAEDVYQEVAIFAVKNKHLVPAGSGAWQWLFEVTRRKALEARRLSKRRPPVLTDEEIESLAPAFDGFRGDQDIRDRMLECLEKLQGHAFAAVRARYSENLRCEQIAARMELSLQGVYSILKRAKIALYRCLQRPAAPGERA